MEKVHDQRNYKTWTTQKKLKWIEISSYLVGIPFMEETFLLENWF